MTSTHYIMQSLMLNIYQNNMFKSIINSSFRKMHYSSCSNGNNNNKFDILKIISKEGVCIKPSTPTPPHLKTHKLSFLDQSIAYPTYVQAVLFYNDPQNTNHQVLERSNLLKHSLSHTLRRFYPLAGKIADSLSIDCNDEGVHYVESRVNSTMLDFLSRQLDNSMIHKFLPRTPSFSSNGSLAGAHVALVQANVFECGSVAVGFSFNHMLFDFVGLIAFLNCWSDIARGGCSSGQDPDFITAPTLYPQNQAFPKGLSVLELCLPFFKPGKAVTKRFVFDSSALAKLKAKATTNTSVQKATKFEVASGLIWKCAVDAFRANSGIQKSSLLLCTVNMRQRNMLQPMGNMFTAIVPCAEAEAGTDLDQLVDRIREAKKTLKPGALKTYEGDNGFSNFCEDLKKSANVVSSNGVAADFIGFTSWLNFGIYEVDFGWGKPEWVTASVLNQEEALEMMNAVVLNDTKCGNGVEAWVSLDEQDMAFLQRNEEFLKFSSLDPSPLGQLAGSNA